MYAILLAPASNRVYAGEAARLVGAELSVLLAAADREAGLIEPLELAGVRYLTIDLPADPAIERELGRASGVLAAYRRLPGDLLEPVTVPRPDRFDDDLVTIPKYAGKTNEQFTRLLMNVTLAARRRPAAGPASVLDPMSGRGTTLSCAWILGHHAYGVESDPKAVEAQATFLRTYLRRKRLKHKLATTPVRRDGRSLGRRLDAEVRPADEGPELELTVFTGDTRDAAVLYGKRRFDAVVTDAPYGIVHGSARRNTPSARAGSGRAGGAPEGRDRSAADLLSEAIPIWARQLRPGGALGISWNTHGLRREELSDLAGQAGLDPVDEGPYLRFAHRVDSSIYRDVFVATAPLTSPS